MTIAPPTLEYAQRGRLAWVSRHRRILLWSAVLFLIGSGLYVCWRPIQMHVRWVYWSRQCASFKMPADIKVIIDDPAEQKKLAGDPNYLSAPGPRGQRVLFYEPVCVQRMDQLDARIGWIGGMWQGPPISFVGTMKRPDGHERLVFVRGGEINGCNLLNELAVLIVPKVSFFDKRPTDPAANVFDYSGPWIPLTIEVAQLDPHDAGHLSIPLRTASTRATLHARLQDDDSFELSLDPNPDFARNYIGVGLPSRKSGLIPQSAIDLPKKLRAAQAQAKSSRP